MYERTFVCGSPLSHLLSLCVGLCQGVSVCVPRPAAGPEAPAPAELCVSGYPGSPLASRTSEHTVSGSPSSKQQSPSPSTKTHTHKNGWTERGVLLPPKGNTIYYVCICVCTDPFQLHSEGLVPSLFSHSPPSSLPHHCVIQLQHCTHLSCTHTHTQTYNP